MAQHHKCNDPTLNPLQFFLAIMHDTTMPLHTRIEAAAKALPYTITRPPELLPVFVEREPWPGEQQITIQIGGLPEGTSVSVGSGQEPRPDAPGPESHGPPELMH